MNITVPSARTSTRRQAAFTFVEVVMAAAVMAVAFASIFAIMTCGLFIDQTSRENARATEIMLGKMEGVRLYSPTQLTNTTLLVRSFTNWFSETNNIGMPNAQGYGIQYTGMVTFASVAFSTSYSSNMQKVTVNIGWTSGGQGTMAHTRSMSTFYANQGLYNYVWTNGH
jgi:hypothetical protein